MIELEIDGKKVEAPQGAMVIEAAEKAGIYIPRFCYHKKLSIVANCRMCLVESSQSKKPLPACATAVTPGMKIYTRSKMAQDAQRTVMEFLLINHPLDCPICDQGGECELQDLAMGYGESISRFTEGKRAVKDKNIGPLIATDMTRCIHCTRCVRFGEEIAGIRELGATGRGEGMEIGTYIEKSVSSELSGNIIDLCPVGALTSNPYRFTARSWEMDQHAGVSPHDCIGTNLFIHTRNTSFSGKSSVMRVVPRTNEAINESWIADRDRFSYQGLSSPDRLTQPQIKQEGCWEVVDWPTALRFAAEQLKNNSLKYGSNQLGALSHPSATLEEHYLLQKLMRGLGSPNLDHRLRALDTSDQHLTPVHPSLGTTLTDIEKQQVIVLIGSNIRHEQPLACYGVRKAGLLGAKIITINPFDYSFNFPVADKEIANLLKMPSLLAGIAKALAAKTDQPLPQGADRLLEAATVTPFAQRVADTLSQSDQSLLLLGGLVEWHPQSSLLRTLAHLITLLSGAAYGRLTSGANTSGGWLAGMLPHRATGGGLSIENGLSTPEMLSQKLKSYLLLGIEPEYDFADTKAALTAFEQSDCVVAITAYRSEALERVADVMLPMNAFAETPGTFVNVEGVWQSFKAAAAAPGESRPAWKILRVLGNQLELEGFNYTTSDDVLNEVKAWMPAQTNVERIWEEPLKEWVQTLSEAENYQGLMRLGFWPIYRVDSLVRRGTALQKSQLGNDTHCIHVTPTVASALGVEENDSVQAIQEGGHPVCLPVKITSALAENTVMIAAGLAETQSLGLVCGPIRLQKHKSVAGDNN